MATILFVRVKSDLDPKELDRLINKRRSRFIEVPGLIQKIYGLDEVTGDTGGIYFFESKITLPSFRETELAKTIPFAYKATDIRREGYEVLFPLKPEIGRL